MEQRQASEQKLTNAANESNKVTTIITKTRLGFLGFYSSLQIVKIPTRFYFPLICYSTNVLKCYSSVALHYKCSAANDCRTANLIFALWQKHIFSRGQPHGRFIITHWTCPCPKNHANFHLNCNSSNKGQHMHCKPSQFISKLHNFLTAIYLAQ